MRSAQRELACLGRDAIAADVDADLGTRLHLAAQQRERHDPSRGERATVVSRPTSFPPAATSAPTTGTRSPL